MRQLKCAFCCRFLQRLASRLVLSAVLRSDGYGVEIRSATGAIEQAADCEFSAQLALFASPAALAAAYLDRGLALWARERRYAVQIVQRFLRVAEFSLGRGRCCSFNFLNECRVVLLRRCDG